MISVRRSSRQRIKSPSPPCAANAGAGGVFLSLTCDRIYAKSGCVLNPHYKGMGNLYGSEYWTYLLPKRVGEQKAQAITRACLPMGLQEAQALGVD